ncbi:MAG: hypothetical protein U0263_11745 [Polyangiaceae bacterium]
MRSAWLGMLLCMSCQSTDQRTTPTAAAPPPASLAAASAPSAATVKQPTAIDVLFQGYEAKLPTPATLSEGNGSAMRCPRHDHATYTLLRATADKLPIPNDAALLDLVPWARHTDACIRQIALYAIVSKIGFERNRLVIPSMHEPEHHLYHQIFVAFVGYLEQKHVAFAPSLFEGMMLDVKEADYAPLLQGAWEEDIGSGKNFRAFVKIDGKRLAVTSHEMHDDPAWPDHTMTSEIKEARVNAEKQFVVTGLWRVESNAKGYEGKKVEPSDVTYAFWPVSRDIVWFDEGRPNNWVKLLRAKK